MRYISNKRDKWIIPSASDYFKVGCNLILIVSLQPDTGRFVLFRDTPRFMMCKQSCENYPQLSSETIQNSVKALIGSRDIITCDCCFLSMKCHF